MIKASNKNNLHRYDDMIDMPHHQSHSRPHMSLDKRAAQFAPFAALSGYENSVSETARLTDPKAELSEDRKEKLDHKLQSIMNHIKEHPRVGFSYFVPDLIKEGGSYQTIYGIIKKINMTERTITLYAGNMHSDGQIIKISDISEIVEAPVEQ